MKERAKEERKVRKSQRRKHEEAESEEKSGAGTGKHDVRGRNERQAQEELRR